MKPMISAKTHQFLAFWSWLACLLLLFSGPGPTLAAEHDSASRLHSAWQDFIDDLRAAERTLLDERHHPPRATDRVLADGYRYLLAHLNREIEMAIRADPKFPEFFRSMDMLRKWTGENPDTMYLKAPIDSTGFYEVVIRAQNTREWRLGGAVIPGRKAPRLVIFQTITGVPGYTGELAEMQNCKNQTLDFVTGSSLKADGENQYRILIGPEKPPGYSGNFLYSVKELQCKSSGVTAEARANLLAVREVFSDWKNEIPLDMTITRLDSKGGNRPPHNAEQVAELIEALGDRVGKQIRFWNLVMEFPMEMTGDRNGDGKRSVPVNGINQPATPFTAGGVAGARQLYASGIFDLQADEALIIKMIAPVEPYYVGFQLNNLWMEGPDQQNFSSSLTGFQNPVFAAATRYYIISSTDPGVQGWVDTTGLERGFHTMRFVFQVDPPEDQLPVLEASLVKLDDLDSVLPEHYPRVTEAQRREAIATRQEHIKMRWRNY
ncbi:MAG: hypothetical protein KDI16_14185 [Halioglobus sp.]|nr:hypothetical protein [Halioglobus sp.]